MKPSDLIDREPGQTVVVNCKVDPYDVLIDRTTIYGNPSKLGMHGDRNAVLRLARKHFTDRFNNEPKFRAKVLALKGLVLGCHCKPLLCHGDIFVDLINEHECSSLHVEQSIKVQDPE